MFSNDSSLQLSQYNNIIVPVTLLIEMSLVQKQLILDNLIIGVQPADISIRCFSHPLYIILYSLLYLIHCIKSLTAINLTLRVEPLPSSVPFSQKTSPLQTSEILKHCNLISGVCGGVSISSTVRQARLSERLPAPSCSSIAHGSSLRIRSASLLAVASLMMTTSEIRKHDSTILLIFISAELLMHSTQIATINDFVPL